MFFGKIGSLSIDRVEINKKLKQPRLELSFRAPLDAYIYLCEVAGQEEISFISAGEHDCIKENGERYYRTGSKVYITNF